MGLLQKERVLTYPDTPKTILTQSSAYKLTAELPNMEYAPQQNIGYSGPNFERMSRINGYSFFSIPHFLSKRISDLNLVKNPSMNLKFVGIKEINSFSN